MSIDQKARDIAIEKANLNQVKGFNNQQQWANDYTESYISNLRVNIETGAKALMEQSNRFDRDNFSHEEPLHWDKLQEAGRNQFRDEAKACAKAWGLSYVG